MATRNGIKHFRELRRTPYITCLVHIYMYFVVLKIERSDKIVLYILFKIQQTSDTVF